MTKVIKATEALKKYYGYKTFREGQEEIVTEILEGRDVLAVMPTGAGKSICYQIPAIISDGVTLVISPLISLMKDQVNNLQERGIECAFVNSSLSSMDIYYTLKLAKEGKYKILYVAPERLMTPNFIEFANEAKISIIAVDEAHCVSQWGHDFRTSYEDIRKFTDHLKKRPVVAAFTATATDLVKKDIKNLLGLTNPYEITTGFDRPNIYFRNVHTSNKLEYIMEYLNRHEEKSGIVYCITRKDAEYVTSILKEKGYNAGLYHAGLLEKERTKVQEAFLYDKIKIIVATNAFGMGIDKPNVSFVIHYGMPKNLEAYYQEAGRGGRDGELAEAILLYNERDIKINEYMIDKSDDNENLSERERMILKKREKDNLKKMVDYAKTNICLRANMLKYFGEEHTGSCNNCSKCNADSKLTDITIEAMKILSSIKRMNEKEDKETIIEVLRSIDEKTDKNIIDKIYDKKYDELSTYGILKIHRKDLSDIIDYLNVYGYIELAKGKDKNKTLVKENLKENSSENEIYKEVYNITEKGYEVLKKKRSVSMRTSEDYIIVKKEKIRDRDIDETLFKLLKLARKNISAKVKIPEFMVCMEGTLKEMTKKKPRNMDALMDIDGLGEYKAKKFGEVFLSVIDTYESM